LKNSKAIPFSTDVFPAFDLLQFKPKGDIPKASDLSWEAASEKDLHGQIRMLFKETKCQSSIYYSSLKKTAC